MANEHFFLVTEAREENGFARCIAEDTGEAAHCELYVMASQSQELVRLQAGDRIAGTIRNTSVTAVRLVNRANPPASLVADLAALARELATHGVVLPEPLEPLADRMWRVHPRQPSAPGTVWDLIHSQLTFLFHEVHPFDDRSLIPRMVAAMRRYNAAMEITEQLDENADIVGFESQPDREDIPFGDDGDWEQPAGCYLHLIAHANNALANCGATVRWLPVDGNWILAEPKLVDLLVARGFIAKPSSHRPRHRTRRASWLPRWWPRVRRSG